MPIITPLNLSHVHKTNNTKNNKLDPNNNNVSNQSNSKVGHQHRPHHTGSAGVSGLGVDGDRVLQGLHPQPDPKLAMRQRKESLRIAREQELGKLYGWK